MWQMSAVGPFLGRAHYFLKYNAGKAPFAEEWFQAEAQRLYSVLDTLLADREFMCGDYSIVDIATFPWIARFEWQRIDLNDYPNVDAGICAHRRASGGQEGLCRARRGRKSRCRTSTPSPASTSSGLGRDFDEGIERLAPCRQVPRARG